MSNFDSTSTENPAISLVHEFVSAGIPCMMHGPAGIGKSDIAAQVAARMDLQLIDIRLPLMESVDLRGLPVIIGGATHFMPPAELQRTLTRPSLLLWDEINAASMSVQVAAYQAILNNRIGEFQFGEGVRHVCAGNRQKDKAGANRMSSALANRMAHIDVDPDHRAWVAWGSVNGIHPLLLGFISYRGGEWLHRATGKDGKTEELREFASPRTWTMANTFCDRAPRLRRDLMSRLVGDAASGEFEAFARLVADLDPPDVICANPDKARLPASDNIGGMYGVTVALAYHIDVKSARNAAAYIQRLPSEYHALFASLVVKRDPRLANAAFTGIIIKSGAGMV